MKFLWKPNDLFDKMLILFVQILVMKENDFTFYNGIRLSKHVYDEKTPYYLITFVMGHFRH